MKKLLGGLVILFLAVQGSTHADVRPPHPLGLENMPRLGPVPLAVIGVFLSLTLVLAGMCAARYKGWPRAIVLGWIGAAMILVLTGVAVVLEAQYEESLANRRSSGPVREPLGRDEVGLAMSLLAAGPDGGFPQYLPWAAIVVNRHEQAGPRKRLVVVDVSPRRRNSQQ